ncbi:hypothetical protein DPMN_036177 [Dreissena polymorpha]|uniref:AIG1-type G domain-containing protein n=1 Tax=Dreissena polymorpha TaxID=45954 RepID=A0A9D4RLQ3_DREPO|nr:hypothetical protein DPMN_036177 [Dreissena polymorpha]
MKGSRIPYTLNVIDTPGFGDARGIDRDDEICDQIREMLADKEQTGIITIDAECYVFEAQATGPTPKQRNIFQLIMSLFGNDIAQNICSMITFANGRDHTHFEAFDETGLLFGERFTFDNSDLRSPKKHLSYFLWGENMSSFERFFSRLDKMERKSLELTLDVLNERKRLEDTIKNIEIELKAGNYQIKQLQKAMQICASN